MTVLDDPATRVDEGYRAAWDAQVHDVSEDTHQVAVDFPVALDSYRSDFGPGCFQEAWDTHGLPVMVTNHNQDSLIGRGIRAESLPDRHRLVGKFSAFDDVPAARAAFANVRDGIYPGWSFHYIGGVTTPHPSGQRSAVRYTKARMIEFGPVLAPAIPGTQVVGLRAEQEAPTVSAPTITELRALLEDGTITEDGFRSMIAEHYPNLREHIVVRKPKLDDKALDGLRAELAERFDPESVAHMTISLGNGAPPGTGTQQAGSRQDDPTGQGGNGGAGDGWQGDVTDPGQLAQDIDAALDQAQIELGDTDTTALPDNIQRFIALSQAAGVAVDELLEQMGVEDPDGPGEGGRAVWSTAEQDDLPDSSFAYVEPGGTKDAEGKTVPRAKRHFPIRDKTGKLDHAHVANARARIAQGAAFAKEAKPKVDAAAKELGMGDDDGKRADSTVSEAPWSFDASKYTPEQLATACLIHDGDATTKDSYKLPVREADGALNRNAVHAAAAVLDGARGGVQASDADKAAAAKKLVALYHQIGDPVPQGISDLAGEGSRSMVLAGDDVSEGDEVDHPDLGTGTVTNVASGSATVHFPERHKIASFKRKKGDGKAKLVDDEGSRSIAEDLEDRFAHIGSRRAS